MPGFGYYPKQIFGADDYTFTMLIVNIEPVLNLKRSSLIITRTRPSSHQENQRKNAAEPRATTPIANERRQARSCLFGDHTESNFTQVTAKINPATALTILIISASTAMP